MKTAALILAALTLSACTATQRARREMRWQENITFQYLASKTYDDQTTKDTSRIRSFPTY